jgi:hypothetical protein
MGGSYKQCPRCHSRALSIATRCPGCSAEFPAVPVPDDAGARELGRFFTPGGMVAAIVIVAVFASARPGGTSHPPAVPLPVADTIVVEPEMSPPADPAAAGQVLVARSWTHVRKSRSRRAGLEAILMPGDTVLADSLGKGWYRVALEGEVMGYAHSSTLMAPAAGPSR